MSTGHGTARVATTRTTLDLTTVSRDHRGRAAGERGVPSRLGGYQVIAHLARGGMTGVYLAREARSGERVALKAVDAHWTGHGDAIERLHVEAALARRVAHPAIVRVLEVGVDQGVPFLAMELLEGEDLGARVERGRLELGATTTIGAQLADALAALHDAGVVHCDLKPANLMSLAPGPALAPRVKLLDFGVARLLDDASGEVSGTPPYMAPEQWQGRASGRTDVYGLGCVLYELCTGAPPFAGAITEVMAAHAARAPLPLSRLREVPPALEHLVDDMLAKDPGQRPAMREVARRLHELASSVPIAAMAPPPRPQGLAHAR